MHAKKVLPDNERVAFTVSDACRYSGLGRSKVYELVRKGRLLSRKVDHRRLILRESLDDLLKI
jgi:excisionase family DNA binding protein